MLRRCTHSSSFERDRPRRTESTTPSATLVTGPDLVDAQRRPATNENVRLLNGPGSNAASVRNGVTHQLKAGDAIIIPAGTGHWFTKIDDHITYLMIRIDPDKVVPLKDAAASKAYLSGR